VLLSRFPDVVRLNNGLVDTAACSRQGDWGGRRILTVAYSFRLVTNTDQLDKEEWITRRATRCRR
jgi:hypothetical protein